MSRTIAAVAAVVLGASFAGCAQIETTHSLYDDVAVAPVRKAPAPVVRRPDRPYREIGVVRARGDAPLPFLRPGPSSLLAAMRQEAGRIGADAVVFPEGGLVREPDGYVRAVAVEWVSARPVVRGPVVASTRPPPPALPPSPPTLLTSADGAAPALPAAETSDAAPVEMTSQAPDGSWKRYVSNDGGKNWIPAPDDEQPPPTR